MINKGASMSGRARTLKTLVAGVALAGMLVLVLVTVVVPLAFGAGNTLSFAEKPKVAEAYSTRAHLTTLLQTGHAQVKWCSEYSTSKTGPWTPSGCEASETNGDKESASGGEVDVFLGTQNGERSSGSSVQHHLLPNTTYYTRFTAENATEQTEAIYSPGGAFTTTGIAKPEVSQPKSDASSEYHGFKVYPTGPTSAIVAAEIDSNGANTAYQFEYAPAESGHPPGEASPSWVAPASAGGTVSVAEDFVNREATLTGLLPETYYCVRVTATNVQGRTVEHRGDYGREAGCFTTFTEKPLVNSVSVRNVTGTSAHLNSTVRPHRLETQWWFEYATSSTGPWIRVPGAEGVVTQVQAEALPESNVAATSGGLANLSAGTTYYVRENAENSAGQGQVCVDEAAGHIGCEPASIETLFVSHFKTFGSPVVSTLAVHGIHGEALRVMGGVSPETVPTSAEQLITLEEAPTGGTFTLGFGGETTQPLAFDAPAEGAGGVAEALQALPALKGQVQVSGANGGPYTVFFDGASGEKAQPAITAASALTPTGQVKVKVVLQGGEAYDVLYHFDYVSQKQFEVPGAEGGFAHAAHTPDESAGFGSTVQYVGADLTSGLTPGETYRFRIVASSTAPGNPVETGEEAALTVPSPPPVTPSTPGACPNEALRTGPSEHLPDCRAYEQLTPAAKGAAKEMLSYGGGTQGFEGVPLAEGGNALELAEQHLPWGGAGGGGSPFVFTREAAGWSTTGVTAQPEAGVSTYYPKLTSPDLGEIAVEGTWGTGPGHKSPVVEYKKGPVGGPYTLMASVPAAEAGGAGEANGPIGLPFGWVASSTDFSKLVLQVGDHHLCGAVGAPGGDYLYEYAGGECRQVNIAGSGAGKTIGSCGARVAAGSKAPFTNSGQELSLGGKATAQAHAVSQDGSRVFFEAQPGKSCSEQWHTYARIDGGGGEAHTVDLGPYRFVAADSSGARVLLERPAGENPGLYLYTSESEHAVFLPGSGVAVPGPNSVAVVLMPSDDLSAVYIQRNNGTQRGDQDIYRYDIAGRTVAFLTHVYVDNAHRHFEVSSDGRYLYFMATTVAGLPAGGLERGAQTSQVFRYDNAEALVECMSCASGYDPAPQLSALFTAPNALSLSQSTEGDGERTASDNGNYVFFDTPAALLPGDTDEQIAPETTGSVHASQFYSPSSDVYEWRRDGVDGCAAIQGCLSLITSGHGGFLNVLLGVDRTGENVFFATRESLLPSDKDTASDIYDARVNGGFAQPPVPVACAADACATPPAPPSDQTPASLTFHGAESTLVVAPGVHVTPKPKPKPKPKRRCKRTRRHRCKTTRSARKGGTGR
jgi:hypothetical protein